MLIMELIRGDGKIKRPSPHDRKSSEMTFRFTSRQDRPERVRGKPRIQGSAHQFELSPRAHALTLPTPSSSEEI